MRNFQGIFETHKQSSTSVFLICMTVPLMLLSNCVVCGKKKIKTQFFFILIFEMISLK